MATRKQKTAKAKPRPKPKARPKTKPAPKAAPRPKAKRPPAPKAATARPQPKAASRPAKPAPKARKAAPAGKAHVSPAAEKAGVRPAGAAGGIPVPARPRPKKSSRRIPFALRRGPDGQPLKPGDILLPGGPSSLEEVQYLFRGVIATQRPALEAAYEEVVSKRPATDSFAARDELDRQWNAMRERFTTGAVEALLPNRLQPKRTFAGVIERAKQRRREIGSFLRGLDIGRTESSMIDSHGEASLQGLMEWAARLEKLADAEEPPQADYGQFHRGLDQLDHTTEALVVDVEATLRRLGGRSRS